MILMEFLFAPTVPSEPKPKNTARVTPDVVGDADGEPAFGRVLGQFVEDGPDHGRVELLGRQTVASADHHRVPGRGTQAGGLGVLQRRHHVEIERVTQGAGLLGAVHDRDGAHGGRKDGDEIIEREGAE
jgi:hypothetical protein